MRSGRPSSAIVAVGLLVLAGCSGGDGGDDAVQALPTTPPTVAPAVTTVPPTTTTTVPAFRDEACVERVAAGDSFIAITQRLGSVTIDDLLAENRIRADHVLHPGDELDVCPDNGVDDVIGGLREQSATLDEVRRQQLRLNELLTPYSIDSLAVDGDSGPLTRQALCVARMGLGLRVSTSHMEPGSDEEEILFAESEFEIPAGAATDAEKWALIDETCQVMFIGEGSAGIVDIFPVSTGEYGHETRNTSKVRAFRYDPAADNGGWHDSASYPVEVDNPLNGNMYKPLYFNDEGQAIHGAEYIPPFPRSKGCARTFPGHQDLIIEWLGIEERTEATWRAQDIGLTITVQGEFRDLSLTPLPELRTEDEEDEGESADG